MMGGKASMLLTLHAVRLLGFADTHSADLIATLGIRR